MEIHKDDFHLVVDNPTGNFSPERNKFIVEETIRKTNENIKRINAEWQDSMKERNYAVASYLTHLNNKGTSVEKYFSKQYLAYLRGDDVRTMLQTKLSPQAWQKQQRIISRQND